MRSLALKINVHNVQPGACSLLGVGRVCTGTLSLSAEPEAQLEEQVGKNEGGPEGGELGCGPVFLKKVYTMSQAGPSTPLRKA